MATNLFTKSFAAAKSTKSAEPPSIAVCEPSEAAVTSFIEQVKASQGEEAASRVKRVNTPRE